MIDADLFAWIDEFVGFVFGLQLLRQHRSQVYARVMDFLGMLQHGEAIAAHHHVGIYGNQVIATGIQRLGVLRIQQVLDAIDGLGIQFERLVAVVFAGVAFAVRHKKTRCGRAL